MARLGSVGAVKWPANPFVIGEEVHRTGQFHGRKNELDFLVDGALPDPSTHIVLLRGPRRIGKTSILKRFVTLAGASSVIAYRDVRKIEGFRDENIRRQEATANVLRAVGELLHARAGGTAQADVPADPERFRSNFLPKLQDAAGDRRLVVLIDEAELLQFQSPATVEDLIEAFAAEDRPMRPLLILSWGRPLGVAASETLGARLRASRTLDIEPFDADTTRSIPEATNQYAFTELARQCLWDVSRGHPFYATALNHVLYERRRRDDDQSEVTPEEFLTCVGRAHTAIEEGLFHAWRQLTDTQSLLVRALAGLTDNRRSATLPEVAFTAFANLSDLAEKLSNDGHTRHIGELRLAADALVKNRVIETSSDNYRVFAPFLGHWLCEHSYAELLVGPERRATVHLRSAEQALESGDRALAKQEASLAVHFAPSRPEACLFLAELEAHAGDIETAIRLLKTACLSAPQTAKPRLVELLTRRMAAALDVGEDPRPWFYELIEVDPRASEDRVAASFVIGHYLKQWESELRVGSEAAAHAYLEELAQNHLVGWRRAAADRYSAVLPTLTGSPENLRLAMTAIRDAFVLITTAPIDGGGDGAELAVERELVEHFAGDETVIARLKKWFSDQRAQPAWWDVTSDLLDRAFRANPAQSYGLVSVDVLSALAFRAPAAAKTGLLAVIQRHVTPFLSSELKKGSNEAFQVLHLLSDFVDRPDLNGIWPQMEEAALWTSDHASDAEVVRFFEISAPLYSLILDAAARQGRKDIGEETLGHAELIVARMRAPKDMSAADGLLVLGWSGLQKWMDLLDHPLLAAPNRVATLRAALTLPAELARRAMARERPDENQWAKELVESLKGTFDGMRELQFRVPTLPRNLVRVYRATWKDTEVNVKIYRLMSTTPSLRQFLSQLWETERRVLYDVATRRQGRALTRLRFAQWKDDGDRLVVVTEPVGPKSLRDLLDQGRSGILASSRRADLWREINALIEAVATLHSSAYLHRSIRPESVFISSQSGQDGRFKLGNFEWSIYLHALAGRRFDAGRLFDRYSAPEVLAESFRTKAGSAGPVGENFSSDIYSLGLVLFELLVRRLTQNELSFYSGDDDYDREKHEEWLAGIRAEIRTSVSNIDEQLLLSSMLEPDVRRRLSDLADAVELSRQIAIGAKDIHPRLQNPDNPPRFVTTLFRNSPKSIENFLSFHLDLSDIGPTSEDLKQLVQQELAGARIYRNSHPQRPLIIEGRRVTFTARPFEHDTTRYREVPFLTVANSEDGRTGPEISRLPQHVEVDDIKLTRMAFEGTRLSETLRKGGVWNDIFDIASVSADTLEPAQREFHSILRVTSEVERALWDTHVVPYRVVSQDRSARDGTSRIVIDANGASSGRRGLTAPEFVSQQVSREQLHFELSTTGDATGPFYQDRFWRYEKRTREGIVLTRSEPGPSAPDRGYLRPASLQGSRAIYRRRQEVLEHLEDDAYLLTALTEPERVMAEVPEKVTAYFNEDLDESKRRVVDRVLGSRPLFLVQGPPGTGKTTLAAEVIQQTLGRDPAARILIASQAHEPLNNLMLRVDNALDVMVASNKAVSGKRGSKPMAVRLFPVNRLNRTMAESNSHELAEDFHPSNVAKRRLAEALQWNPEPGSRLDNAIVTDWRAFLESEQLTLSLALSERIKRSANLVYVTANDKSVNELVEDQAFDLLIFEEAAKAYPLEVIAPMRLSRRWLLIGDHEQLPPFDIESFHEELPQRIRAAVDGAAQPALPGRRIASKNNLLLSEDSAAMALKIADFFEWLHEEGWHKGFADILTQQWRMHPDIGDMLQATYYGKLKNGDADALRTRKQHRVVKPPDIRKSALLWIDVPPAEAVDADLPLSRASGGWDIGRLTGERRASGGGYRNPFEASTLVALMKAIQVKGYGGFNEDIAFLSPYRGQVWLMEKFFENWDNKRNPLTGNLRERAFTVDSFQGRQAAVVVVSLVRNNVEEQSAKAFGFLASKNRAGVMFSRAESLLIVIGSSAHFEKDPDHHINEVFRFIQKRGVVIPAERLLSRADLDRMRAADLVHAQKMQSSDD